MEKTIYSGDVVYATKLEKPDYINKNDICAVIAGEPLMKRIKDKIYDKKTGRLLQLILISDNCEEYEEEIIVDENTIEHIFKIEEIRTKNILKR